MRKFGFLEKLIGENQIYEEILIALMEEPMKFDEIHEYLTEEMSDYTYARRTLYDFLKKLQDYNLVVKEYQKGSKENVVFYKIPSWEYFRESTIDPLRGQAKRRIFDKVEYN